LDKEAHWAYLTKICKNLSDITEPAHLPQPPKPIVTLEKRNLTEELTDDDVKSLLKDNLAQSLLLKHFTELSKVHSEQHDLYQNPKILRAMCNYKGNHRW
jgi:hypothetical protein